MTPTVVAVEVCASCRGRGITATYRDCPKCGGTGKRHYCHCGAPGTKRLGYSALGGDGLMRFVTVEWVCDAHVPVGTWERT